MNSIVFGGETLDLLRGQLLGNPRESCALLLCNQVLSGNHSRSLIREVVFFEDSAYLQRTTHGVQLNPANYIPRLNEASSDKSGVVFVHTHPFGEGPPEFSPIDDKGEESLASLFEARFPDMPRFALVLGPGGCTARRLGTGEKVRIVEIGSKVRLLSGGSWEGDYPPAQFNRQIKAFGEEGQRILSGLKIAIVGLGGTGSAVAQELALLGIRRFQLFDDDIVEETNLNRLVGAGRGDIGVPKVSIAERTIKLASPDAVVVASRSNILSRSRASSLLECDAIFCCTDTHGSRALLNQISYQYYIPCFDMGTVITTDVGRVTQVVGRVQLLSPGMACLTCTNILNADNVRRDFLTIDQLKEDPYFLGAGEPQPAVISINSTLSSLAVTMFLGVFTEVPLTARFQMYDGVRGSVRPVVAAQDRGCVVCSTRGVLGRGDSWELPARLD